MFILPAVQRSVEGGGCHRCGIDHGLGQCIFRYAKIWSTSFLSTKMVKLYIDGSNDGSWRFCIWNGINYRTKGIFYGKFGIVPVEFPTLNLPIAMADWPWQDWHPESILDFLGAYAPIWEIFPIAKSVVAQYPLVIIDYGERSLIAKNVYGEVGLVERNI